MSHLAPVISMGFTSEPAVDESIIHSTNTRVNISRGRYQVVSVHGFAALFGIPFTNERELAFILEGRSESIEDLIREMRGTATVTLQDTPTGATYFFTDLYGAGKIFLWEERHRWAVSSSITDLVNFLGQNGVQVKKAIENAALLAFAGYGGGAVSSPYKGIECIDQFQYLELTTKGRVIQHEYSFKEQLVGLSDSPSLNQKELIQAVADDIRRSTSVFSSYSAENYICQLTGGLDSRVVFASLVATNYKEQYATFTYGLEESPDMVIARQLTATYGLEATTYSGMRASLVPEDPTSQVLWSLKQTGGMTAMSPASIGGYPRPDSVILAGGWGEMYRGGYPDFVAADASEEEKIKWVVNWILRSGSPYGPRISYGGLFSNAMVERSRDYAKLMLAELRDLGLGDELLAEWMYMRWSTRFNVAEITRTVLPFAHRADPLCVPDMMQLIYATPFEDRKNGALEMDLVRALSPGMESHPYDKDYLTDLYIQTRGLGGIREFDDSLKPKMKWHFEDKPTYLKSAGVVTRPTEAHRKEALRVKMPLRFIVRAEENRKKIQNHVCEVPEEMGQIFNLENLRKVTDVAPGTRPEYRRLETISAALSWHFDQD